MDHPTKELLTDTLKIINESEYKKFCNSCDNKINALAIWNNSVGQYVEQSMGSLCRIDSDCNCKKFLRALTDISASITHKSFHTQLIITLALNDLSGDVSYDYNLLITEQLFHEIDRLKAIHHE